MKIHFSRPEYRDTGLERRAARYDSIDTMHASGLRRNNLSFPLGVAGLSAMILGGSLSVLSRKHNLLAKGIWLSGAATASFGYYELLSGSILERDVNRLRDGVIERTLSIEASPAIHKYPLEYLM